MLTSWNGQFGLRGHLVWTISVGQMLVVSINHIEGNAIIVNKIFLNEMMANSESYFVSTSIGSSQ